MWGKSVKGQDLGAASAGSGSEWGRGEQAGDSTPQVLPHGVPLWGSSIEPGSPALQGNLPQTTVWPVLRPSSFEEALQPSWVHGRVPAQDPVPRAWPSPGPHLLLPHTGPAFVKQPVGHLDGEARRDPEGRLPTEGDG